MERRHLRTHVTIATSFERTFHTDCYWLVPGVEKLYRHEFGQLPPGFCVSEDEDGRQKSAFGSYVEDTELTC